MARYAAPVARLIQELGKLPGIGRKTAQRLAFHILGQDEQYANSLATSILEAKAKVHFCSECFDLTDQDPCIICRDEERDRTLLCVVEQPSDVSAMERTREYNGLYHVLHGAISPMDNVGPEKLRLRELILRLNKYQDIEEVILATNATVEGEATSAYIERLLTPSGIKLSRLAQGIPMGQNLEYTDQETLGRALSKRTPLN